MMKRIALATLAGLMLTGCGASPTAPTFSSVARVPGAHAQMIKVPAAFSGSGAISMAFQFPTASAYHVAAVGSQVEKLVATLKTRSFLLTKTVATAEVTRAQMKNGQAAVRFDALKAGDYTVAIQAFDAAGNLLGSSEGAAAVAEGKVSPVAIDLRLNGATSTPAPTTSTGGLALTVTISDGGVVAPTPAPTVKPTPVPSTKPVSGAWNTNAEVLRTASFKGCLFGASTPIDSAEALGAKLGRPIDVTHTFYQFDQPFPNAVTQADVAAGRVPLISFNAITKAGVNLLWADIAAGKQDARLHEVAKGLKALAKPVFFTFNHEPENDEMRGTPAEYRAAWKHVSDVLAADGATNAVKVFVCMGGRVELNESYYPGDGVVDWIGADPYNWAYTASQPTAKWKSFEEAASPFYTWAKAKHKPLMIGETGCSEDPTNAARKGEWLKGMGETLKKWTEFKALVYFNSKKDDGKGINYWYVESAAALAGFRQVAQDPYFAQH